MRCQPVAEPDRENIAVLRKGLYRPENKVAGRLAQPLAYLKKENINE